MTSKRPAPGSVARAFAASLLLLWGCLGAAQAQEAATVTHLAGTLSALKADGQKKLLGVQSTVSVGDLLTTEADTYARLKFLDGAEVVMRPGSQLRIDRFKYQEAAPEQGNMAVSMLRGGLRAITGFIGKRNPANVQVGTPTATIGIRGTHFGALFCQSDCGGLRLANGQTPENGLHVDVADGAIVVSNPAGQTLVGAGQFGFVRDNVTPPRIVPPDTGIRIGVPSGIARNNAAGRSIGAGHDADCIAQ